MSSTRGDEDDNGRSHKIFVIIYRMSSQIGIYQNASMCCASNYKFINASGQDGDVAYL